MLFESGKFFVGCNYWASHAGIYMWRNWNAEQVEQDLATLEKGTYTYNYRIAIARGGVDLEHFEFTV